MGVEIPPPGIRTPRFWDFKRRADSLSARQPAFHATSWWRSPERNTRVGGAINSQHLDGTAADWDSMGAGLDDLLRFADDALREGLSSIIHWGDGESYVHTQLAHLVNKATGQRVGRPMVIFARTPQFTGTPDPELEWLLRKVTGLVRPQRDDEAAPGE